MQGDEWRGFDKLYCERNTNWLACRIDLYGMQQMYPMYIQFLKVFLEITFGVILPYELHAFKDIDNTGVLQIGAPIPFAVANREYPSFLLDQWGPHRTFTMVVIE